MTDEYICLIFAAHREPKAVETIAAEDDDAAAAQALRLMIAATAQGYELWLRGKKVASYFPAPTFVAGAPRFTTG